MLNVMYVPIIRHMLPLREPLSYERPMFRFFNGNHEIGAGEVVHGALLWEPIGAASGDCQFFEGMQCKPRDRTDVVCPAFQGKTARLRYPIEARALGMMIEQLFGKPAPVVVAGAEEKNRLHRSSLGFPAICLTINHSNLLLRAAVSLVPRGVVQPLTHFGRNVRELPARSIALAAVPLTAQNTSDAISGLVADIT
jgi:hypothetical protein